jgi:hypothetical protein
VLAYVDGVLAAVEERLAALGRLDADARYFHLLALYHEDMHGEAFVYTRQTHGYPAPRVAGSHQGGGPCPGDVEIAGGSWRMGADAGEGSCSTTRAARTRSRCARSASRAPRSRRPSSARSSRTRATDGASCGRARAGVALA